MVKFKIKLHLFLDSSWWGVRHSRNYVDSLTGFPKTPRLLSVAATGLEAEFIVITSDEWDTQGKVGARVIQDFCKLAWDYVAKGVNPKLYATVSEKIGINPQDLQHIVEGLLSLLVEACKLKVSSEKFEENLKNIGFNAQQCQVLSTFYTSKRVDMNHALLESSIKLPMFKDLQWSVHMRLGTRALPRQITPQVILNLKRENVDDKSLILQTDPGNLVHITQELERALKEATSQHANRVHRRFNPR